MGKLNLAVGFRHRKEDMRIYMSLVYPYFTPRISSLANFMRLNKKNLIWLPVQDYM
jgi:hypothetical protein